MNVALYFIFAFFALLVVTSLVAGLALMVKSGPMNERFSNKLMWARVFFQFLAVMTLFIIALFTGQV